MFMSSKLSVFFSLSFIYTSTTFTCTTIESSTVRACPRVHIINLISTRQCQPYRTMYICACSYTNLRDVWRTKYGLVGCTAHAPKKIVILWESTTPLTVFTGYKSRSFIVVGNAGNVTNTRYQWIFCHSLCSGFLSQWSREEIMIRIAYKINKMRTNRRFIHCFVYFYVIHLMVDHCVWDFCVHS